MRSELDRTELEVETLLEIRGRAYVLARTLQDSSQICVTSRSTLGGASVEPWLEMPRAVSATGALRTDLLAFCLRSRSDLSQFQPGQHVVFIRVDETQNDRRWLEPWHGVTDGEPLERELRSEVGPGHFLFNRRVTPVARRQDTDDVLFEIDDVSASFARVHLTWSGKHESDPRWPSTSVFASWDKWLEQMELDHRQFVDAHS